MDAIKLYCSTELLCFLGVSLFTLFLLTRRKSKKTTNKYQHPLPPEGPKFADFLECVKANNQQETIAKYGDIFMVKSPLPGIPTQVIINDPDIVKELTVRQANMYRNPSRFTTRTDTFCKFTQQVVGVGVTGLKGEEWRWRKTALLKAFHKSSMFLEERELVAKVVEEGKRLCEELNTAAESGEAVEIDLLTTQAAVGVVLYFLFGRDLEFDTNEMRDSAAKLMECLGANLLNPWHGLQKLVPGTSAYKLEQGKVEAHKIVDSVVAPEIQMIIEECEGKRPVHPDRKPGSVIATLINNEPRFSKGGVNSMIAEGRVFVQAGFETTAHSLAFALGMMAERPDLADRLAQTGRDILGDDTYSVDRIKKSLDEVTLVKNFFMESVRLYPLAPALGGECTDDITIATKDGIKYTLPKGTATLFLNLALQRRGDKANEIVPDRWDVPVGEQPFLQTFQNGAHSCPGKPLSILEGRVFLLLIATQFEFEFPKGTAKVEYEENLLLRPKHGMPLVVKKRGAPTVES